MGGWLHGAPWTRNKTGARGRAQAAPEPPAPAGEPPPEHDDDLRGLCVSDSVCGMFAEIKPPPPHA